jgi:hypothetical protein
MIEWLLIFTTDNKFSQVDVILKRCDSDKIFTRVDEKIDSVNLVEIENSIINVINLYVPLRENVYAVLDQGNFTKYKLEKMMPKLSSRIHQVIYANV